MFEALFVPDDLLAATGDQAFVDAMLEAEIALAKANGWDLVAGPFDAAAIMREGRADASPAAPLVRRLRALDERAHDGATSQDIVDTAMMLVAKRARALILDELATIERRCHALAEEHRGTVMAGRTLMQQALPITFGNKVDVWLAGLAESRRRLEEIALTAQLGGAVGRFDDEPVVRRFADELGLEAPGLAWHANRVRVAELGSALELVAGACGKIAHDVILLAQTEVAEVRVPTGGSTAMQHKRNPAAAVLAVAAARQVAPRIDLLGEHERAAGAWQAEWPQVANALAYTGATASLVRETLDGLEVDAGRMQANLVPGLDG